MLTRPYTAQMAFLKALLAPGSLSLLSLAVLAGLLLHRASRPRLARVWMSSWLAAYFLLSLPVVAQLLYSGLAAQWPAYSADRMPDAQAIVVLSSGAQQYRLGDRLVNLLPVATTMRVLEAARVYRLLSSSPLVIVSGSNAMGARSPIVAAMRDGLIAAGVSADHIAIEPDSRDTHGSSLQVRTLLQSRGLSRIVLVTSDHHMQRALRTYRSAGIDAVGAPSPARPAGARLWRWHAVIPDGNALSMSEMCLHEYGGLLYYALRGWV